MNRLSASIVIPVYNQSIQLEYVLNGFRAQTIDNKWFEIILVDDGSNDEVSKWASKEVSEKYGLNIHIIHTENHGRACARNIGIRYATSPITIFCDADRIPGEQFVERHIAMHSTQAHVVAIGTAYDYYGLQDLCTIATLSESYILNKSRIPVNYRKLYKLAGEDFCNLQWLSFLVGNSSVTTKSIKELGGFSEAFTTWGFEHFELGYRYHCQGYKFAIADNANNYHIPHKRNQSAVREEMYESASIFQYLHPELNSKLICKYLLDALPLTELQSKLYIKGDNEFNV